MGLPKPDLVLHLTTPLGKAAARLNYGDERYENQSFQEKVIANFQSMVDSTWQVATSKLVLYLRLLYCDRQYTEFGNGKI